MPDRQRSPNTGFFLASADPRAVSGKLLANSRSDLNRGYLIRIWYYSRPTPKLGLKRKRADVVQAVLDWACRPLKAD